MSASTTSDSPQVKLMLDWAEAFKKGDVDLIASAVHKDYRHSSYPRSIGKPERNREEWLEHMRAVHGLWDRPEVIIHSITEVPGKVILHVTVNTKTTIGVDLTRESITIGHIDTDEDGSLKIKHVEDFTDSKAHLDFVQAVEAAKAK